jgi:hypothetical protein
MSLIPEVEFALVEAATRHAHRPARMRRRARLWTVAPALAATLVAVAVAVAAVVWRPLLGDSGRRGHPSASSTVLPAAQLKLLGVERRAQSPADRTPAVQAQLRLLVRTANRGVRTAAIRTLEPLPGGRAAILVPEQDFGDIVAGAHAAGIENALCVLYPSPPRPPGAPPGPSGSAQECWSTAALRAGTAIAIVRGAGGFHVIGLAPDGVARVAIRRRDGSYAMAAVTNNFFDHTETAAPYLAPVGEIDRWIGPSGATVGPPSRAARGAGG